MTHPSVTSRTGAVPDTQGLRIPDRTLPLLRDLVRARTGMHYDDARIDFMRDRLVPLALERGFDSLLDYYYLLKYDPAGDEEWKRAIDALSVQETYFWREFDQVRALVDAIVPSLVQLRRPRLQIWSIPCASGEEPLSLAMALLEGGWFSRVPIEIHAGDASPLALRRAGLRRYGARAFRQFPEELRRKYFDHDAAAGEWIVRPEVHRLVTSWQLVNVVRPEELSQLPRPDVIFCRNLFIYFELATVQRVVETFANQLWSPGYLCVGAAESLLRLTTSFELRDVGGASVYVKA